jgi:serine/threonine-protein kinase PRP4
MSSRSDGGSALIGCSVQDKRDSASPAPEPGVFELAKDKDEGNARTEAQAQDGTGEQISAADYDPSLDRREDAHKRVYKAERNAVDLDDTEEVVEEEEEEEEDVDDMFAISTSEKKKKVKKVKKVVVRGSSSSLSHAVLRPT